jgi:transposase
MQQALRRSSLVPAGFVVESAVCEADRTVITLRPSQGFGLCPSCGTVSRRVHSHYRRRAGDLPLSGRMVELVIIARRAANLHRALSNRAHPKNPIAIE